MAQVFSKPKLPPPPDPVRLPVEDDNLANEAAARRRAELLAARGRQSTNLSGGFNNQKLGQ